MPAAVGILRGAGRHMQERGVRLQGHGGILVFLQVGCRVIARANTQTTRGTQKQHRRSDTSKSSSCRALSVIQKEEGREYESQ